jgi:hypothetical protein
VTFSPFPKNEISPSKRRISAATASSLLGSTQQEIDKSKPNNISEVLQSTFGRGNATVQPPIVPFKHGLVHTVLEAYNQHHALVLRPDDIWLAILSQFSLFVNGQDNTGTARSERLRQCFVAHEGKCTLEVWMGGTRHTVDYTAFADLMVDKVAETVVDPLLRTWMIPSFSTTTPNDRVVASVLVMATLKNYFEYELHLRCGIPQVTLAGTREDWLDIYHRVDKLVEYGPEATAWRDLLRPVLARFAHSFEDGWAESSKGSEFWQRIVHYKRGGSGPSFLSGWITAFCAFNDKGVSLMHVTSKSSVDDALLSPAVQSLLDDEPTKTSSVPHNTAEKNIQLHDPELDYKFGTIISYQPNRGCARLEVDGVHYHVIDTTKIPSACAEVDVRLDDNGEWFDTVMVAGLVGMSVTSVSASGRKEGDDSVIARGEVAPVPAWWIYISGPCTHPRALKAMGVNRKWD